MADATRYVNTAADIGGNGTTNNTSSGDGTHAYKSLNDAEAGLPADITTGGDQGIWTIICEGSAADTTPVSFIGTTTSATYYIYVKALSSATYGRHQGVWSDSKYRITVGHATCLLTDDNNIRISGLQLSTSVTSSASIPVVHLYSIEGEVYVIDNIMKDSGNGTYSLRGINAEVATAGVTYIWNNIIYNLGTNGVGIYFTASPGTLEHRVYNNTVYGTGYGFSVESGVVIAKNNLLYSCSSGSYGGAYDPGSTNNLSQDGFAPPYNTYYINKTVSFVSAGSDFHLAATDTDAIDKGADLSGTFTTDIDGQIRTGTWDIGADEYVATGVSRKLAMFIRR